MPKLKLSKSVVDNVQPGQRDEVYWDQHLPGFGLRVKPTGVKSFIVQYRNRTNGKSRRTTLGKHGPFLTFPKAREMARAILADASRGKDPVSDKAAIRNAPTVRDLCADYLSKHAEPKKRPSGVRNDRAVIDKYILASLAGARVADVGFQDLQALHNSLEKTPYQANRTLALLSKMFALSIRWGWRSDNPARGIEKFPEQKRDRWLSDAELLRLTNALDDHPNQTAANAIRLQLLTGARIGEVLSARWSDFDADRGVWTKPSHHTKQRRTEHLPLSGAALALLADMRGAATSGLLFPGRVAGQPLKELKGFWKRICPRAYMR